MAGFIFGGNTGETQETLKRKRSVAEALAAGASKAPRNVGEGLTAVGNALLYRSLMNKIDASDAAGRASADADRNAFMSGFGLPPADALAGPPSSAGNASIPMPEAASEVAATSPSTGDTYEPFMAAVKEGGLTNPYGLAAVAATGRAESGWSAENANRTWSDPSESGKPGTAGGIMSWRGPRYQALAATGDLSPQGQAKFFLSEDPALIQKLNGAKSVEEAQSLINQAWAFAGHDRPSAEVNRRLSFAKGYLPSFQGGAEVASLDPAAGMGAAQAIDAAATPSGSVDPAVAAQAPQVQQPEFDMGRFGPNINLAEMPPSRADIAPQIQRQTATLGGMSPVAAALASPKSNANAMPPQTVASALMQGGGTPSAPAVPRNQVAQALLREDYFPAAPSAPTQSGPSMQQIMQLLNNPYASPGDKAMATAELERRQKQSDPAYQLDRDIKQAQLDALKSKPAKTWQKLDDTTLFNPETGETKAVGAAPTGNGQFRFEGKAVDAQALNGLMDAGRLTPEQAQQIAAGKTITGPNGEIIFLTPEGVFGKASPDAPALPLSAPETSEGVDIFGGQPAAVPAQPAPVAPQPPQAPEQRQGMIQLTEPKVTLDESKAAGFADRMTESGILVDKFANAGLSTFDQAITNSPYVPGFIANNLVGDDFQKYDQARRDFINAQLRRESGAVISDEEFDNANKQYFPQPGDKPDVLKQKARNRETVINAMKRDAGPTYKEREIIVGPQVGDVEDGYRFKGGAANNPDNWERVQ